MMIEMPMSWINMTLGTPVSLKTGTTPDITTAHPLFMHSLFINLLKNPVVKQLYGFDLPLTKIF
jgi:hypothetical protein